MARKIIIHMMNLEVDENQNQRLYFQCYFIQTAQVEYDETANGSAVAVI